MGHTQCAAAALPAIGAEVAARSRRRPVAAPTDHTPGEDTHEHHNAPEAPL
jgi:hypothetical protein